jgi:Na+-driven multidrug efflux pump
VPIKNGPKIKLKSFMTLFSNPPLTVHHLKGTDNIQLIATSRDAKIATGVYYNFYALVFGTLAGVTILLIKPVIFNIVDLNGTAQSYLNGMLYICAYYCIGKSLNSTIIGGIFPAGGDPKFGLWCDFLVMWFIILPLGYMSAFVWNVHPIILYAVISLDEIIKLPLAAIRYRQYRWLNNITRDFA